MNRLQAEGHHAPGPHGGYEGAYRAPYPPPPPHYDHQEPRRLSNQAHPHPLPGFTVNPNRQLPQLPEDGPYGRPHSIPNGTSNGLPAPSPHQGLPEPSPIHTGYRPPINGSPHEASPQSAPPDYRARMSYQSNEGSIPSESTPPISVPPHAPHYVSPAAQVPVGPSYPFDPGYAQNPAYGARQQQQRKAARATQVSFLYYIQGLYWHLLTDRRRVINVAQGKPSVMKDDRLVATAKKITSLACTKRCHRTSLCP